MSHIYTFVRKDLSIPQQIVQHGHAVHEIGMQFSGVPTPNIVLLSVENEEELINVHSFLGLNNIRTCLFFEPDINQHTSIATEPISSDKRTLFKKFKLLK